MPLEKSALAGVIDRTPHPQASAEAAPAARPGDFCRQCSGHLIRLDGKLSCGRCGLSTDAEFTHPFVQTVGLPSQNADLARRNREMEAELAALKVENTALKEEAKRVPAAVPTAATPPGPIPTLQESRKNKK